MPALRFGRIGNLEQAGEEFRRFVGATFLPLGDRALFQAADVLARDLENGEAAIEYYTRLLTEYPGSVLAAEARARIRALRGDGV